MAQKCRYKKQNLRVDSGVIFRHGKDPGLKRFREQKPRFLLWTRHIRDVHPRGSDQEAAG